MSTEDAGSRRKPIFEGVAYDAPDGRNLGATLRLDCFGSTGGLVLFLGGLAAVNLAPFVFIWFMRQAAPDKNWALFPGLASAVSYTVMLALQRRYHRPRLEIYGDTFVVAPGGGSAAWERVTRFGVLRSHRADRRACGVVATLDDGSAIPLVGTSALPFGRDRDVEGLADFLNAFRNADDAGRMRLIGDFRQIRLPTDRRS